MGNVKPAEVESIVACECDPEWDNPCALGTDCLNRILMVECNPGICPAGAKCMNQSFVLRQYPAMEPFHTMSRGWGLRTLENIKVGRFVIEYVGEIIDDAEYKRRLYRKKELKNENFYFLTIDNNRTIDAEPKGNLSRFMSEYITICESVISKNDYIAAIYRSFVRPKLRNAEVDSKRRYAYRPICFARYRNR